MFVKELRLKQKLKGKNLIRERRKEKNPYIEPYLMIYNEL